MQFVIGKIADFAETCFFVGQTSFAVRKTAAFVANTMFFYRKQCCYLVGKASRDL